MDRPGIRRVFRLALHRRADIERELIDEMRSHLDLRAAELERQGMSPANARLEAERRFGSLTNATHQFVATAKRREGRMHVREFVDAGMQNLRVVARQLRRSPAFTIAVALTLALGVGANATMFGVLDRLLLRAPAGVSSPQRIGRFEIEVGKPGHRRQQSSFGYGHYRDLRRMLGGAAPVAAYAFASDFPLGRGATAQSIHAQLVTPSYFAVVGVHAALGRVLADDDGAEPAGQHVIVVSDRFWNARLGGRRGAVGERLLIGQNWYTIVGVTPPGFSGLGLGALDAWIPITAADGLRFDRSPGWLTSHTWFWLGMIARLPADSAGVREVTRLAGSLSTNAMWGDGPLTPRFAPVLRRLSSLGLPDVKVARLLTLVSFLVLMIACANVANLLLARAVRREREIAVRLALGVSRRRLASLLATESLVLALLGGAIGLVVVRAGGGVVRAQLLSNVTAWSSSPVDGRLLGFTASIALALSAVLGLVPLLESRKINLTSSLRQSAATGTGRHASGARVALLVTQVTLCTVLLVGTGLFVQSLRNATAVHMGMDPERVLLVRADLRSVGVDTAVIPAAFTRLRQRALAVGGVRDASVAMGAPFVGFYGTALSIPGRDSLPVVGDDGYPTINRVDERFFTTLGTRIVRGRAIAAEDVDAGRRVVVVNDTMAGLYWPGRQALGQCIKVGGDTMPCSEVVGVSETAHRGGVVEQLAPQLFLPLDRGNVVRVLLVRFDGDAGVMAERVRRALQVSDPALPFLDVRTLESYLDGELRPWRMGAAMLGGFAVIALLIGAVGLYGSFSYEVAQRSRELSIRRALGAPNGALMRLLLARSLVISLGGIVLGLAIALLSGGRARDLLYEVSPYDPLSFVATACSVFVVALFATFIPARRATRVDVREAMTAE